MTHKKLKPLRDVGQMTPGADSLNRGKAKAMQAIMQADVTSSHTYSLRRRIMKLSVAATMLIGLGIASIMLLGPAQPSAAQELLRIAQINDAYEGWVRVEMTFDDETAASHELENPIVRYRHTATGEIFELFGTGDQQIVQHTDIEERSAMVYDPENNSMIITRIRQHELDFFQQSNLAPITLEALIDSWQDEAFVHSLTIDRIEEDALVRFDLTLPESLQGELYFQRAQVWVEPERYLIERVQVDDNINIEYRYEPCPYEDIYSFDIPDDVQIFDTRFVNRPSDEDEQFLLELKEHYDQLWNREHYLAITIIKREPSTRLTPPIFIYLRAYDGIQYASYTFELDGNTEADWANLRTNDALELLEGIAPTGPYSVENDTYLNHGVINTAGRVLGSPRDRPRHMNEWTSARRNSWQENVSPAYSWLGQINSADADADLTFHFNHDEQENQIFMQRKHHQEPADSMIAMQEESYLLDLTRGGVIVERHRRIENHPQTNDLRAEQSIQTNYQHTEILPGLWIPTYWQVSQTYFHDDQSEEEYTLHHYLIIDLETRLDPIWFAGPVKQFSLEE